MTTRTVALKNPDGSIRGNLEISTGRIVGPSGETLERLTPLGDHDAMLADYAATYYHANIARQVGGPVMMNAGQSDERLVTMDLGQGDVHIDAALPNYAAGYKLASGCADIAMPAVVVPKASNKFFTWDTVNAFKRVIPNGGTSGGLVPEINPTLSSASYSTVEYALGAFVPTQVQANADAPLKPYQAAVNRIMNALLLEREIRVATLLQTSGSWDASVVTTLAAGAKWNGGASSDPISDLHTIIEGSAMPVTGIVMSERTAHSFQRNANVQKYTGYKNGIAPLPNISDFAAVLNLPPIYQANMKYFASGTTLSYVWGNHVVLLHSPPQNPPTTQDEVASAYTFRWNGGDAPDGSMSAGFLVRTYYDPKRGSRGGNMVVCVHNDAEVMTSTLVGGLILNAWQ
jgi:hypothetical protein